MIRVRVSLPLVCGLELGLKVRVRLGLGLGLRLVDYGLNQWFSNGGTRTPRGTRVEMIESINLRYQIA